MIECLEKQKNLDFNITILYMLVNEIKNTSDDILFNDTFQIFNYEETL